MSDYKVVKYTSQYYAEWNEFVAIAKNATFLFHRDFMEYHQDRFDDASFLIYKNDTLVAIFPANKAENCIYSHQGLTYGGLLIGKKTPYKTVLKVFRNLLETFHLSGVKELVIKMTPKIYHQIPSDELDHLLFCLNAKLIRRDLTLVIDTNEKLKITDSNRKRGIKKAHKQHLTIKEVDDFEVFWNLILIPNLEARHGVKPVHTLEEITYLKSKFPNNIRQFNVYKDDELVAGTTIFETETVAHAQYISANSRKQELGSLDMLFNHLIDQVYVSKKYVDFGICNEDEGKHINSGLMSWKESFGARSISQDFYKIATADYDNLNTILI